MEVLIRAGAINRYVVPLPSQLIASFGRVVFEEDVLNRFLLTAGEALAAGLLLTVVGIGLGALLHRVALLRMATETWVAALAAAPIVLMYPLFLVIFGRNATTIVMIGFVAGLAPVILKTLEALSGTRRALIDQELDADDIDQRKDHSESQSDKDGRQSGRKQDFPEQLAAGQVETAPDIGSSRQTQTKAISKAGARWL